tara:strand:+ start:177 stop:1490 length:1314 start_codon:yes stop_codon:yes gene_type:complete
MAVPLPFASSSRVTADLNLSTSVITLEGVITDGDAVLSSTGANAKSFIDFSGRTVAIDANYNPSEGFSGNKISLYSSAYGFYAVSDALFTDATCDTNHTSGLSDGSSTSLRHITMDSTSKLKVGMKVAGAGIPTGATVAEIDNATCFTLSADVTATNTNTTLTFGNDKTYADGHSLIMWDGTETSGNRNLFKIFFGVNSAAAGYDTTAVANEYILAFHNGTSYKTEAEMATGLYNLITNEIATINAAIVTGVNGGSTKVEMTYTNPPLGDEYTNNTYPRVFNWVSLKSQPLISTFSGGIEATSNQNLSAGDTVQQLYAILSNSNAGFSTTGHYIVGLQLPYLSSVRATSADEKFKSVLMYTTSGVEDLPHKDKDFNYAQFSGAAGNEFDAILGGGRPQGVTFQGMRAIVDKATFVQVGGEPNIYSFTILMIATNMIL